MADLHTEFLDGAFFQRRDDTRMAWLGMAGVAIHTAGTVLLIDPLITYRPDADGMVSEDGVPLRLPLPITADDLPRADAVLYTHADADHLGELTAQRLARLEPLYVAPSPVAERLEALGIEAGAIRVVDDWDVVTVGAASIQVTPALHDWQAENPWQRGDCVGYRVTTPHGTVWHPGDTRLIDDLYDVDDVDVLWFDIAEVGSHLGPQGSAALARATNARLLLAYHYGTYDLPPGTYASCDPAAAAPYLVDVEAPLRCPNPGEVIRLPLGG
jgi:L-ascorbate metabolism protein UlaG (beta-lactamase superfamily)